MKMVKSLLLGSAAALVAVTAGQAAELPVKAKPVEYVKICSLYGAGFYYMPGTDMCIKIGGWVRAEAMYGFNGNGAWGAFNENVNNRYTNNLTFRARGYITADAREQTAYGTARAYIAVGVNTSDVGLAAGESANAGFSANRAFVQWAGFTAGIAQSFYDFYSVPAVAYNGMYPASDTGDPGWFVLGYTAQFGGGFSATLSMETRRTTQIINQECVSNSGDIFNANTGSTACGGIGAPTTGVGVSGVNSPSANFNANYGGQQIGDIVGNLRVDQAWGAAQLMGAAHEVNATYWSDLGPLIGTCSTAPCLPELFQGGPAVTWGYAVGAGLKVLFPQIGPGDWFQGQVNYTQGALRYLFQTPNTDWGKIDGANEAYGVLTDCVYGGYSLLPGSETNCHLTTAWGFNASYEHFWTPAWHTSVYGGYYAVSYDKGLGSANAMLCSAAGDGILPGNFALEVPGCDNDWSLWFIGSRTQWNVTSSFYMGVDVMYENLNSATVNPNLLFPGAPGFGYGYGSNGGAPAFQEASSNQWIGRFRIHKDFLP